MQAMRARLIDSGAKTATINHVLAAVRGTLRDGTASLPRRSARVRWVHARPRQQPSKRFKVALVSCA